MRNSAFAQNVEFMQISDDVCFNTITSLRLKLDELST